MIEVKRLYGSLPIPIQHHEGDAGYDLMSIVEVEFNPGEQLLIPTSFAFAIPKGKVGLIKDRSSMAKKQMHTSAGVIDSTYRGEVHVMIMNHGKDSFRIFEGDKIAQMIIMDCHQGGLVLVHELDATDRGDGGFGSTGK